MPQAAVDPARLEGEALRRWYTRTPDEIERERAAAAEQRRAAFLSVYGGRSTGGRQDQDGGYRYGALYAPPADDLEQLRREQVEQRAASRQASDENRWMAVPALAPVVAPWAVGAALRFGAPLIGRALRVRAPQTAPRPPQPVVRPRGGETRQTIEGRLEHQALSAKVAPKPGWRANKALNINGVEIRPDVQAPPRATSKTEGGYLMELKPATPSGRRAGAKAAERYTGLTGRKTRVIYYKPKDPK